MYKLIVSDMDGTFLNSKGDIPYKNKETVKKIIDRGLLFALATGRLYGAAKFFAKQINVSLPIIACNGGLIRDMKDDKIIYSNPINSDKCKLIFDFAKKNDIYFHFYTADVFYVEQFDFGSYHYNKWNETLPSDDKIKISQIFNPYEILEKNEAIYKIQLNSRDLNKLAEIRKELECLEGISCSSSWYNNIEIMGNDVSKGSAVKLLADNLKIDKNQIISIGDNENDISMLKYTGLSIVMGNAKENVKKYADYIADENDNDGFSKALDAILFTKD